MEWLSLAAAVLKLANLFLGWLERRNLLQGRDAEIALSNMRAANSAIERAIAARRAVQHNPDSVLANDRFNRDRRE